MKSLFALPALIALALPVMAITPTGSPKPGTNTQSSPAPRPAKGKAGQQATTATISGGEIRPSAGTTPAPAAAPMPAVAVAAAGNVTLDAYLKALADAASLTKDEQTDIKTYYLDDGTKLTDILNSATLTPFEQTQQVEDLRKARNAKIEALLHDADRRVAFSKTEAEYRVPLTELAETGGLVPATPPPIVPQPTATTPGQAEKVGSK